MHYGFTTDETELIGGLARLLDRWPTSDTLGSDTGPFDKELWQRLVQDGWTDAMAIDAVGVSRPATVALGERFGRVCPRVPWTVVLGYVQPLLASLPSASARALMNEIAGGRVITAAVPNTGTINVDGQSKTHDRVILNGTCELVPYAQDADAVLLRPAQGVASSGPLLRIDINTPGVSVAAASTVDLRHGYGDLTLVDADATFVAGEGADLDAADVAAQTQYSLLLSAEALGGLARLLDDSVRYVTDRRQFGVPVGSFQAVKHLLAHTGTCLENGRALAYLAASYTEGGEPRASADAAAARLYTGRHYLDGCERLIQAHGGFGFTWEAGLHVWYRNAMANAQLPARPHLAELLDSAGPA